MSLLQLTETAFFKTPEREGITCFNDIALIIINIFYFVFLYEAKNTL